MSFVHNSYQELWSVTNLYKEQLLQDSVQASMAKTWQEFLYIQTSSKPTQKQVVSGYNFT